MAKPKRARISCDSCELLSINGVACHEHGCPNARARWDAERAEWVKQYECFTCGYMADEGSECCGAIEDDEDGEQTWPEGCEL